MNTVSHRVIDAWSIRNFVPSADDPDVRTHFFATFGKFARVTNGHWGEMLAAVTVRAGRQHEIYPETKLTPNRGAALALTPKVAWTPQGCPASSGRRAAISTAILTRTIQRTIHM